VAAVGRDGRGASWRRLLPRWPARAPDRRAGSLGVGALRGVADRRTSSWGGRGSGL